MKLVTALILAIYAGAGAVVHVLFVGIFFNPSSMLSWACLLGWPVVLIVGGLVIAFVMFVFGAMLLWIWDKVCMIPAVRDWRHRRWHARIQSAAARRFVRTA